MIRSLNPPAGTFMGVTSLQPQFASKCLYDYFLNLQDENQRENEFKITPLFKLSESDK